MCKCPATTGYALLLYIAYEQLLQRSCLMSADPYATYFAQFTDSSVLLIITGCMAWRGAYSGAY